MEHSFVLTDIDRQSQFALMGSARRILTSTETVLSDEVAWAVAQHGQTLLGFTWLAAGWAFDPYIIQHRADRLSCRLGLMHQADNLQHVNELSLVGRKILLGATCERVLWSIHIALMACRSSAFNIADIWLAKMVWGTSRGDWPKHWRKRLATILDGLTWLHVTCCAGGLSPQFGSNTALLTGSKDLRGQVNDLCRDDCQVRDGSRHSHFAINVGRGFLGQLEQFAVSEVDGVREYSFPRDRPHDTGPSLREAGRSGQLSSFYLPAKLGAPDATRRLGTRSHRLLQAIIRETTRPAKRRRKGTLLADVASNGKVPDLAGKLLVNCPYLSPERQYAAFGGNGFRRGLGYRLATEGGWLAKAGYGLDAIREFVLDLDMLANMLALVVVGIDARTKRWVPWDEIRVSARSSSGCRRLERLQLRVYAEVGYVDRWNSIFGWAPAPSAPTLAQASAEIMLLMRQQRITQRALSEGAGIDASFLCKLLNGKKPWPAALLTRARAFLTAPSQSTPSVHDENATTTPSFWVPSANVFATNAPMLEIALGYLQRGWSVVPQIAGAKRPCVRWKIYQDRLPTEEKLCEWFHLWPNAGLAVILGPISNLFSIDVDGEEAHAALLERLGMEPLAPKSISGSGKPCRYHLFFQCPNIPTKAKATPWHPKLEFRGKGGIVIIPPSRHKSGNFYYWADGRTLDDITPLPDVPREIVDALATASPRRPMLAAAPVDLDLGGVVASPSTLRFLQGLYANGPNWNGRLFQAACDLAARQMPFDRAEHLLLQGAGPWNEAEANVARRTIASAYAQDREASRY